MLASSPALLKADTEDRSDRELRVIAYNIYKCTGWPNDRALAKQAVSLNQMADRLAMELQLYAPHIVCFSESPSETLTQHVADALGMQHVRFPSGGAWPGTLLSQFDVIESENAPLGTTRPDDLFTRHWGRATLRVPTAFNWIGSDQLVVHSAHLHPAEDPSIRLREVPAMLKSMREDLTAKRPMLLIGDLNHRPDTAEYRQWIDAGWTDTFAQVGSGDGYTIKADTPYKRIDYVMAAGPLASHIRESRPLFEGAFRIHENDEHGFALSDHLPQYAVFRA